MLLAVPSRMIDVEAIRRLNSDDVDSRLRILELNEDRLYSWLVEGSIAVVREDLGNSIEYVMALRKMIKAERPDYISP